MRVIARAVLITFAANAVFGQSDTARPTFEVASIKPSNAGDKRFLIRSSPGGSFNATNAFVNLLITFAYNVKPYQISGGPDWLNADRYDIVAKAEENANPDQVKLMVQTLLEDRFKLTLRHETKELPIYALVTNKGGKYGPNLQEATGDCPPRSAGSPTIPPPPAGQLPTPLCGTSRFSGRGRLLGSKVSISQFIDDLSMFLGRPVVDRTGLTGKFDIKLEWNPVQSEILRGSPESEPSASESDSGPSIFTAIQEQLGLKLDPQKGPVEVLVINHAERPNEN